MSNHRATLIGYTFLLLFVVAMLLTLVQHQDGVEAKALKKLKKLLKPKKLAKLLPYLLMAPKIFIVQK